MEEYIRTKESESEIKADTTLRVVASLMLGNLKDKISYMVDLNRSTQTHGLLMTADIMEDGKPKQIDDKIFYTRRLLISSINNAIPLTNPIKNVIKSFIEQGLIIDAKIESDICDHNWVPTSYGNDGEDGRASHIESVECSKCGESR